MPYAYDYRVADKEFDVPQPVERNAPPRRRSANVTLPETLLQEARALGLNVSKACESGLSAEVRKTREKHWQIENTAAIDAWNRQVETEGLPLAAFRQF